MSHAVLSTETQPKDAVQGPTKPSLASYPPTGAGWPPNAAALPGKTDPQAAASVMAHYAEVPAAPAHKEEPAAKAAEAKAADAKAAPPDIVHTGLGAKIDELAAKSPTLEHDLQALQKQGWSIQYGAQGKGTFADRTKKSIHVDPSHKGHPLTLLQYLAHEAGHAMYKPGAYVGMDGKTREQYIDGNVKNSLNDEGEATITNLQVRDELLKAKAGDIGVAGAQAKKYIELYKKYPQAGDRDKLREEIGKVYAAGEHPSTAPKSTYGQYYAKPYADAWDKAHPPAKK